MRQIIMKLLLAALLCLLCGAALAEGTAAIGGYTPLEARFTVPETDIIDASISVTFAPEDRERLGQLSLVSPAGVRYDLWNGRVTAARGIGVTEGPSAITLDIHIPEAGEWAVIVASRDGERVPIHVIPHLNREIRLNLDMRSVFELGDTVTAEAWFQKHNGRAYEDMPDGDIYTQSGAELLLYTPGTDHDGEPSQRVPMAYDGKGRFRAMFKPDIVGIWTAKLHVESDELTEELPYIAFEVTITATREPEPTPVPEVARLRTIRVNIDGLLKDKAGNYIDGSREDVTLSWTYDGETDYVDAALLHGGEPVITGLESGDAVPLSALEPGQSYTLRIELMPKNGTKPTVKVVSFAVVPPVAEVGGITIDVQPVTEDSDALFVDRDAENIVVSWAVDGPTDSVTAVLLEDGITRRSQLTSGGALPRSLFQDGKTYTVQISAMPLNGTRLMAEPLTEELSFALYPDVKPITGLTLSVSDSTLKKNVWRFEGGTARLQWEHSAAEVDRYVLQITDSKGAPVVTEALPGRTKSYSAELPRNDDYTVSLTAIPKYARDKAMNATATLTIRPHIKNWFEKYWYFILGGLAVLLASGAAMLVNRRLNKPEKPTYVTGVLHVSCAELELDETELRFSLPKKNMEPDVGVVQEGEPITRHPLLMNLKGTEAHRLLTGVKVSMAQTDGEGKAEGETRGASHQLNAPVIRLTSVLPTGAKEQCYVGQRDAEASMLRRRSPDGDFEFVFWGETKPETIAPAEPEEEVTPEPPQDVENPPADDAAETAETTESTETVETTETTENEVPAESPADDWMNAPDTDAASADDWMNAPDIDAASTSDWMNTPETDNSFDANWMNEPDTETTSTDDWMNAPEEDTTPTDDWMNAPEDDAHTEKAFDDVAEDAFSSRTEPDSEEQSPDDAPIDPAAAYAELLAEHAEPSETEKAYAELLAEHAEPSETEKAYAELLAEHAEPSETEKAYAELLAEHAEPSETEKAYAELLAEHAEPSETEKAYAELLAEHAEPSETEKAYAELLAEHAEVKDEPTDAAKAYADFLNDFDEDEDD